MASFQHPRRNLVMSALLGGLMGFTHPSFAGSSDNLVDTQIGGVHPTNDEERYGFSQGSIIVAPIPFSNPLIGSGLALGAGYLFQVDEGSGTSVLGIGTMKSDNGSEAHGLSFNLSTSQSAWKISATAARAALRYDLLVGGLGIPIKQNGNFARLQLRRKVAKNWSVGVEAKYLDTEISSGNLSFGGLESNFTLNGGLATASVGLLAEYDTRDSDIFATTGSWFTFSALHNEVIEGRSRDYPKATALFSHYRPVGDENVFAIRAAGCSTERLAPFFDLCSVGGTDAMRGFNPTLFLDARMLSLQGEYRHKFTERLGAVAFAGYGTVGETFGDLDRSGYAAGVGVRIGVSKNVPVNFAIDVSHNNLGESILYISVGERF